jgi:hypothetical protein
MPAQPRATNRNRLALAALACPFGGPNTDPADAAPGRRNPTRKLPRYAELRLGVGYPLSARAGARPLGSRACTSMDAIPST